MRKIIISLMVCVTIFSALMAPVFAVEFNDLKSEHWAYEYISTLANAGIINGYTDGSFKPSGTITRGEFIKLVMSSCIPSYINLEEADIELQHWAAPYVWIAEEYEVLEKGYITKENINQPITRIEMARLVSLADMIVKKEKEQIEEPTNFTDVAGLSSNDLSLLRHAVSRGLITGYGDQTFKPNQTMTRAEAATMIYRFTR